MGLESPTKVNKVKDMKSLSKIFVLQRTIKWIGDWLLPSTHRALLFADLRIKVDVKIVLTFKQKCKNCV